MFAFITSILKPTDQVREKPQIKFNQAGLSSEVSVCESRKINATK